MTKRELEIAIAVDLLCLATCYDNDLYREAIKLRDRVSGGKSFFEADILQRQLKAMVHAKATRTND